MTINELLNRAELADLITEEIDDLAEDTAVSFEVWAIGYNADSITDVEMLVGTFTTPEEAIACADTLKLSEILIPGTAKVDRFSVEVETVIADPESVNIGTIFYRDVLVPYNYAQKYFNTATKEVVCHSEVNVASCGELFAKDVNSTIRCVRELYVDGEYGDNFCGIADA